VYGLGDALEISRVDGRLRRRRDGVTGEEGVEGITDLAVADQRDEADVAGSLFSRAALTIYRFGFRQPKSCLNLSN
jgi:hypothetical protein